MIFTVYSTNEYFCSTLWSCKKLPVHGNTKFSFKVNAHKNVCILLFFIFSLLFTKFTIKLSVIEITGADIIAVFGLPLFRIEKNK